MSTINKLDISVLCYKCGVMFTAPINTPDLSGSCPTCYNKNMEKTKCFYCEQDAKYTQPGKTTGKIIDVCDKHFTFRYMG